MAVEVRSRVPTRRRLLWLLLVGLVLALLVILVWLAARFEALQVQDRLERDALEAVAEIRTGLTRNVQSLQALQFNEPTPESWSADAVRLLRESRELVRIEWRDDALALKAQVDSPFRAPVFARLGRANAQADVEQVCATARRFSGPAYSSSYFVPMAEGLGMEVMETCLPLVTTGKATGYLLATYSLQDVLVELLGRQLSRCRSPRLTARGLPCVAPGRVVGVFLAPSICSICPATRWSCGSTARAVRPTCFPMC